MLNKKELINTMVRNHEIKIKVSDEELETLRRKARLLGFPVSTMLRHMGLGSKIKIIED